MKKIIPLAVVLLTSLVSVTSCGEKENSLKLEFEAETTTFTTANPFGETLETKTGTVEGTDIKYVRLNSAWIPSNPEYKLHLEFEATKQASAKITFRAAAPIKDDTSGNLGNDLSALFDLKFNNEKLNIDWNEQLGSPYDASKDSEEWFDVTINANLIAGKNTIDISTIEKSGNHDGYVWHCTDSVLFDNVTILSAGIAAAK